MATLGVGTLGSSVNPQDERRLLRFTQGVDLDQPLAPFEVEAQKAWVGALAKGALLTPAETQNLLAALDEAKALFLAGTFPWRIEDEDVHMNLERFLTEKLGDLGKRIHLGRSRNDLIATTLRLFVADNCLTAMGLCRNLVSALRERAKADIDVIVPGLTHLQFGQPIRLSQIYLAQAWMLKRDLKRLEQAEAACMEVMPLGSAALAGTTLNIDLKAMAHELGFASAPVNSCDSVGDRDFLLQALSAYALLAGHLSRMAEDYIVWASAPFSWVHLPKAWSTGSSIMPNKRNPDVAELVRSKSAQVIGASASAQVLLKGLVTSYSSDLHELKRVYLGAWTQLSESLEIFPHFIAGLEPNPPKIRQHLESGHLLATEVANELTGLGLTFREAYQQTAELVELANAKGVQVHQLGEKYMAGLTVEKAVEMRGNSGGTCKASILAQLDQL